MSTEQNKAIARRLLEEVFSQGKYEVLNEILTNDYLDHDMPPGMPSGPAGVRLMFTAFRSAFPDVSFAVQQQLAEGEYVVTRYLFKGTHLGDLYGIPPTVREVTVQGISTYRIENGRMKEAWVNYDMLGLMAQLGAVPA